MHKSPTRENKTPPFERIPGTDLSRQPVEKKKKVSSRDSGPAEQPFSNNLRAFLSVMSPSSVRIGNGKSGVGSELGLGRQFSQLVEVKPDPL